MPIESDHSTFGGSSAARWRACSGALVLSNQIVTAPSGSVWADEGTAAHSVAERILTGWQPPKHIDPEMVRHAQNYAAGVEVYKDLFRALYVDVEHKVISNRYVDVGGTIDALIDARRSRYVIVIDYKYGAGLAVSATKNEQLMFYAALALEKLLPSFDGKFVGTVLHAIYQPRGSDPGWKEYEAKGKDIYDFKIDTYDRIQSIKDGNVSLTAGSHCRWCEAKPVCPAYFELHVAPLLPQTPVHHLTNAQIYDIFKRSENLGKYREILGEHIKAQCQAFGSFESYTVAPAKGKTKFLNPIAIQATYPQQKYPGMYDTTLRTPKQALEIYPELREDLEGQYSQSTYEKLVTNEHIDYTEFLDEEI